MIAETPPTPISCGNALVPRDPIWRLSVAQYHEMIHSGILTEDDPVELLEGWLVVKMSKNPPHSSATRLLRKAIEALVPPGWIVDSQEAITTPDSEPEPDLFVARGSELDYLDRHPMPDDLAFVVEVANSPLERDQTSKLQIYARAGIVSYWILNLVERQLEVYTIPSRTSEPPGYSLRQVYANTETVPVILAGQEIGACS